MVSAAQQLELVNHAKSLFSEMSSFNPPARLRVPERMERPRLRGSSLPLCPLCVALDTVRDKPRLRYNTLMSDFYTMVGSEYHIMLQKWFGIAGAMYGKFECPKCKALYPKNCTKKDNNGMLGPVFCDCDKDPIPCMYVEFNPTNVPRSGKYNGHVDGILQYRNKFLVLEIKTTSLVKLNHRRLQGPDPKHEIQAQSYRYVMPRFLDTDDAQWHDFVLVWYFDRADPRNNIPLCLPYDPEKFGIEINKYIETQRNIRRKHYHLIKGTCSHPNQERFCPYNIVCFSPQRDALLEEMLPGYISNRCREV